jgi:hypothetical protein
MVWYLSLSRVQQYCSVAVGVRQAAAVIALTAALLTAAASTQLHCCAAALCLLRTCQQSYTISKFLIKKP